MSVFITVWSHLSFFAVAYFSSQFSSQQASEVVGKGNRQVADPGLPSEFLT